MAFTYSLTQFDTLVQRSDGVFIPNDANNIDWIAYQAWLTAGNIAAPYAPVLSPQQQFNVILSGGINTTWVISGGPDGSLNGLYAIDQQTQFNITAEVVTILSTGVFSTGASTRFWLNMTGQPMQMNTTQFRAFAMAVSAYVNSLYAVLAELTAGATVAWPSNQVSIDA
jgi:hypothetical protein